MALVADYGFSDEESGDEEAPKAIESNRSQVLLNKDIPKETANHSATPAGTANPVVPPAEATNPIVLSTSAVSNAAPRAEDEELESFVKKVDYGEALPEKPAPSSLKAMQLSTAKGKVKIAIPSLQDIDSDDSSSSNSKRAKMSAGPNFLSSLPAPRNSTAGKEIGRALVPHTLTKNRTADSATLTLSKPKNVELISHVRSLDKDSRPSDSHLTSSKDDSDDEEISNNFFSLDSSSTPDVLPSTSNHNRLATTVEQATVPQLTACTTILRNAMEPPATTFSQGADYADIDFSDEVPDDKYTAEEYGVNSLLQDEQFLRLQGKKNRGKEEINIIDVHTDDQKASESDILKGISEEVDPSAYAHRKKGDGPSGQQKRKHQITYLAFQAKERELELKNTWAANRQTKKQTQAKYGF